MSKPKFNKAKDAPDVKTQGDKEAAKTDVAAAAGSESKDQDSEVEADGAGSDSPAPEKKSKTPKGMEVYFKNYPKEKTFFRTADGQVFLAADRQWAVEHQKHIGGEVETIKRS